MAASLLHPETLLSLLSLTVMEIVLGIDNIVLISILTGRLARTEQPNARRLGVSLTLILRIALLGAISWIMRLERPLVTLLGQPFSGRSLILIGGGVFLVYKATREIHEKIEIRAEARPARARTFWLVIGQILLLDVVFSLDSVITAVGMARQLPVMIAAMVLAVGVMFWAAQPIGDFINRHPSVKVLALSFLLLIGVLLVVEGMGRHVDKGYIYFAMVFSLGVELLNIRVRKSRSRQPPGPS